MKGIYWEGHTAKRTGMTVRTGFAIAGKNYLLSLMTICSDNLKYVALTDDVIEEFHPLIYRENVPMDIRIQHNVPYHGRVNTSFPTNILVTVWETIGIPPHWRDYMNSFDMVIVPSEYVKDGFLAGDVTVPIEVIPHAIDPVELSLSPAQNHFPFTQFSGFKFLSVFQWTYRKGYDILLRAFLEEFQNNDDVCLVLQGFSVHSSIITNADIIREVRAIKDTIPSKAKIFLQMFAMDAHGMNQLYKSVDAFVLPTRGDGFGLPMLEALCFGLPVIAPDKGGQTEFLNHNNSYLIQSKYVQCYPQWYLTDYSANQLWVEPDIEHLKYLMRYVYENYSEAKNKAINASVQAMHDFSPESIGKKFKRVLDL